MEAEVRRRIKDRQWGWESQEKWGGRNLKHTHTYSLINILWECGPMVNHSPGNNQEESLCCFFNMLPEFQWTHTVICSVKREERGKKTRCVAHESAGSVCIEGALMYGPGQSDKRGESWLGWLKSPCWHLHRNPWGKKEKPWLFEGSVPAFPRPLPPYRLSLPMSAQCIKTCPPQNKDPLKRGEFH